MQQGREGRKGRKRGFPLKLVIKIKSILESVQNNSKTVKHLSQLLPLPKIFP